MTYPLLHDHFDAGGEHDDGENGGRRGGRNGVEKARAEHPAGQDAEAHGEEELRLEPAVPKVYEGADQTHGQDDEDGRGVRDEGRLLSGRRQKRHDDHAASSAEDPVHRARGAAGAAQ